MAGRGKRFNDFISLKPLIELDGKTMIEHVIDYFPRNADFVFICHEDHLKKTNLNDVLMRVSPESKIVSVSDKMLKGPAYTSIAAFPFIGDNEEIIVNYCDFIQTWDYNDFITRIDHNKPDGAIVSFKGFHPSSLGDTYYAYLTIDENGYATALKEKESFSEDQTQDFASTGTYYFSSGKVFKKYVTKLVSNPEYAVGGEFYMSLPFNLMIKDGLKILNYEIDKFICLGTSRDYELYKFWSEFFLNYAPNFITFDNINLNVTNIFPLAGNEYDFKSIGINSPNFMVPIMNRTLIDYSFKSNPRGVRNIFIGLKKHQDYFKKLKILQDKTSEIVYLEKRTRGNAETIFQLRDMIEEDTPVCVCGSTYILEYNERKLATMMEKSIDVILFSFSHHESILRNPNGFGYGKLKNNIEVEEIAEKKTISDNPYIDQALVGTAIFKHASDLFDAIKAEIGKQTHKKLYYLTCINNILKKRKVVIFEVDKFVPIRTITNYKEFLYWQDYFDKREYHPYYKMLQ
jgi:NDP-sugar pyrophosphorylase family protein